MAKNKFSKIVPDSGKNTQADQAITEGMIQSPVAALNMKEVFSTRPIEPYGVMEQPGSRDLNIKRPEGGKKGPDLKSTSTEGKQGEKA